MTKDKFVLNPYGNGYLYRSGDLARWLPDGNIDFLGRIDEQIKIRGFRVELDEIQSVILSVANIQDVAVIVKEINGGKVICAYIVANGDIDVQSVEDALRHKLPDYMIPASITQIKSLPITRNGKLDKRALPEPEFISSTDYVAPRTHIEEALVEVFEDVLGIKHIGITDDFFRMGGDSIKVIRVVTKMRDKDYDVSVIDIMQYREIRRIANHVKAVSHVTGTEYAEKSGNIDTSISDVLTPDYTDILRKSVLEYTTDYPQDAPLLRYAPLQMQKYMLLNKASVITDTFYLDMPYSAVCTLLNSIIASQGALRTRYDVNAGYLEELQFSSKSIPLIPIGPHDDFEQIIKSYKEMIHKFDFFCQNRLLSTFVVVQKGENSTCVLFSAQHAVWDAMSSSILTSYIYHLKDTSSVSLQNISYARYCSKYSGSMDSYVLTKTETRILDRMTKLSQRAFRSADLHSEKDYHPVSFINLPLNHEVCAQFQSYPIEAAILIIHSLLHDDGNNKHEMYAIMRHNRRDENQSLLGLVLDMDICVYDVANNRMTAFKNRSALPFTEKVRLYVERNRVDFLPTIPFINYTGMYERHDLMLSDGVRNVRIPITSQERSYHGTSMEYTFNNDVFAGGVFGKSVSEEEIWKAIEYAKERLKTLKWVETDVT